MHLSLLRKTTQDLHCVKQCVLQCQIPSPEVGRKPTGEPTRKQEALNRLGSGGQQQQGPVGRGHQAAGVGGPNKTW